MRSSSVSINLKKDQILIKLNENADVIKSQSQGMRRKNTYKSNWKSIKK